MRIVCVHMGQVWYQDKKDTHRTSPVEYVLVAWTKTHEADGTPVEELCGDARRGYSCTREKGHEGGHQSRNRDGLLRFGWPQVEEKHDCCEKCPGCGSGCILKGQDRSAYSEGFHHFQCGSWINRHSFVATSRCQPKPEPTRMCHMPKIKTQIRQDEREKIHAELARVMTRYKHHMEDCPPLNDRLNRYEYKASVLNTMVNDLLGLEYKYKPAYDGDGE